MSVVDNKINIVIGSWGSYNECNGKALGSEWICLNDYDDWEEIEQELEKQGFELDGIDEELFVQDIENFPADSVNWDYMHPQRVFETLKKSGVLDEESKFTTMEAYCEIENYDDFEGLVDRKEYFWDEDIYLYPDFDWYKLGYHFLHEVDCVEIPDFLENYIDYERYGKELEYSGFHEYSDGIIEIR